MKLADIGGPSIGAIPVQPPKFKPTPEQSAIVEALATSSDNLLVDALAGAAKTSTLVLAANDPRMIDTPTLCLAFNKKIADEMKRRLPSNCESATLNSLGHRTWGRAIGRRLNVDSRKNYKILKALFEEEPKGQQDRLWEVFADLNRAFSHAKTVGWVPSSCTRSGGKSLIDDDDFFESLEYRFEPYEEQILTRAVNQSINDAYAGNIDFDDQIYMPTCFPATFVEFPLTMIDEAQDLNALQHEMLRQIVRENRIMAVGDPCQAIYAFRGAFNNSMELLSTQFAMTRLRLSTSFRCPIAVVKEARWRAPDMQWPEWAKEGEIRELSEWDSNTIPENAAIICRNNAPIFSMAVKLFAAGRYAEIVGNDIGKGMVKTMKGLGPMEMTTDQTLEALEKWERIRLSKTREHGQDKVRDMATCMEIFIMNAESLGGSIAYAERIMSQTGRIKMMTGHKSKGLEFPDVFILDQQLLRTSEEHSGGKNQDRNLLYVMQTRAQERLTYITTEGFVEGGTNDA